jgi:hypothetical protein
MAMASRRPTQRKGTHPGKKCLRGKGVLYTEAKVPLKLTLTPTAIRHLEEEALKRGISLSEVVEQWARGLLVAELPSEMPQPNPGPKGQAMERKRASQGNVDGQLRLEGL